MSVEFDYPHSSIVLFQDMGGRVAGLLKILKIVIIHRDNFFRIILTDVPF